MLDALAFVKGAVSKKDLVPALTHFHVAAGRISGFNGKLAISAPIALDIDCCPKAEPFVRAIEACQGAAQLHMTPGHKLAVRSGKFRAHIETVPPESFPEIQPEGEYVTGQGKLLPALKSLFDLIGSDASRPWATGVLLDGLSAFATNNVILAEQWLGYHFPYRVTIPQYAVRELLRIGEEPSAIRLTATSATFLFDGDRWLRTQLVAEPWPDIRALLDSNRGESPVEISAEFWEALEVISPFLDEMGRVYLDANSVRTNREEGAAVDVPDAALCGIYQHKMLSLLKDRAQRICWADYPSRVAWYGSQLRGLIIGMTSH